MSFSFGKNNNRENCIESTGTLVSDFYSSKGQNSNWNYMFVLRREHFHSFMSYHLMAYKSN